VVDLLFDVRGSVIPRDHAYSLYAAVSREVPDVHAATGVGIFAIRAVAEKDSMLRLIESSRLRLRLSAERIPSVLALTGKSIELDGHTLQIGMPRVVPLVPAPTLTSSLVTIKLAKPGKGSDFVSADAFLAAARGQLGRLGVQAEAVLLAHCTGPRQGQPLRRVVRIKGQIHVGYGIAVGGLTGHESIELQERGLGGRRLMGCGLFLPVQP
jgi:CRISPR-associated protein Cas6